MDWTLANKSYTFEEVVQIARAYHHAFELSRDNLNDLRLALLLADGLIDLPEECSDYLMDHPFIVSTSSSDRAPYEHTLGFYLNMIRKLNWQAISELSKQANNPMKLLGDLALINIERPPQESYLISETSDLGRFVKSSEKEQRSILVTQLSKWRPDKYPQHYEETPFEALVDTLRELHSAGDTPTSLDIFDIALGLFISRQQDFSTAGKDRQLLYELTDIPDGYERVMGYRDILVAYQDQIQSQGWTKFDVGIYLFEHYYGEDICWDVLDNIRNVLSIFACTGYFGFQEQEDIQLNKRVEEGRTIVSDQSFAYSITLLKEFREYPDSE